MATRLIYGDEDRLLPWALERLGFESFRRDAYSIGLERDGDLVAVVVYDNFSSCDCQMHIASDGTGRWMNKELLISAFAYPFAQLGFLRVTALVPESNVKALEFDKNIGFVQEGRHPCSMPNGEALISMGMLRTNCRFFREEPQP